MKHVTLFSALLCASLLSLGACQSLIPQGAPPAKIYTLNAPHVQNAKYNAKTLPSVKVLLPQAAPGLETERVALRKGNNRIDYFRDIKWADTSNALIQAMLVESFDNSNAFKAVGNDLIEFDTDYNLLVEIRDFQIEYKNDKPYAYLRFVTKLINTTSKKIVMTRTYQAKENASGDDIQSIMQSFDNAYKQIATQMVQDSIVIVSRTR